MVFRRKRFLRRGFSRPIMRERARWISTNFNETGVDRSGTINEFNLVDQLALQGGSVVANASTGTVHVRRIIIHGGVTWQPTQTTFEQEGVSAFGAVYVIDREDTDADLVNTGQGDILEGGVQRVLWTNAWAFSAQEIPTAQMSDCILESPIRVDIDLKVRVNLKFDDVLVFGFQFGSNVGGTMSLAQYTATHRVLFVVS